MATRRGGFSGGLNPFGGGSLGNLSQYDIGADLADLEVYKVEVAWGNGLATDEAYLAALTKSRDATDPNTQRRESAQNKLDDAVYRIGRSVEEAKGIDQLIAFDTAAIAKMQPDNLRYRGVKDSLDSEMAQRRSRDYGKLVVDYNAGKTSSASLLTWVKATLAGIASDAPDYQNWSNVSAELADRIVSEKDSTIYQDFQRGRIKAPEFLAYLTARRNSYETASPQYAEWARKLEDATQQVKDTAQSAKDSAFFNRYQEGKVSDQTYLTYLRDRLNTMPSDDPQREEWQHRLTQATFSLAEDKLRFDVQKGKAPVGRLISFYQAYRRTLNPESAEWRTVTRNLDALGRGASVRRAGGGGGGSSAGTGNAGAVLGTLELGAGPALTDHGKAINPKYSLSNILGLFAINPTGGKKDIKAANDFLALNKQSLGNALRAGDQVWLFFDPRTPGATVAELDPQGKPTGRRIRGSAYLEVQSEAYSNLLTVESSNFMGAAEYALANGKYGDYAAGLRRAAEALDQARIADAQYRGQNWDSWYKGASTAVDNAMKAGDYGAAMALSIELLGRLKKESANPYLDDTRRAKLDTIGEKLAANPIMPSTDGLGNIIAEGALRLSNGEVILNPGWHHVLDAVKNGKPDWGLTFDTNLDPLAWGKSHVTVQTTLGERVVTGEVSLSQSDVAPLSYIHTESGVVPVSMPGHTLSISFLDEHGQIVRAYSIDDGKSWINPGMGMGAPFVEVNADLHESTIDGVTRLVDGNNDVAATQNAKGEWVLDNGFTASNPGVLSWYGQRRWEAESASQAGRTALYNTGSAAVSVLDRYDPALMDVGGPGLHMMLVPTGPSGVNLVSSAFLPAVARAQQLDTARISSWTLAGTPSDPWQTAGQRQATAGFSSWMIASPPTTQASLARQLPPDTPARYDGLGGFTLRPPSLPVSHPTVLPALTPPALIPPPALRAIGVTVSVGRVAAVVPPALKPAAQTPAQKQATAAISAFTLGPVPKPPPTGTGTMNKGSVGIA
jgi:hypothetical protein